MVSKNQKKQRLKIYQKLLSKLIKNKGFLWRGQFEKESGVLHDCIKKQLPELWLFMPTKKQGVRYYERYEIQGIVFLFCIQMCRRSRKQNSTNAAKY